MKTIYTEELADRICETISKSTMGLARLCAEHNFPAPSTLYHWFHTKAGFRRKYIFAKEMQADRLCEEIIAIADTEHLSAKTIINAKGEMTVVRADNVAHRRLQISTRQWVATNLRLRAEWMKENSPNRPPNPRGGLK